MRYMRGLLSLLFIYILLCWDFLPPNRRYWPAVPGMWVRPAWEADMDLWITLLFFPAFIPPRASLVAQRLKRLPPMWETWVQSLGREEALEKEMVTHSSIFAWRIPWTEKPGRLQSMGSQRVGHDWATSLTLLFLKVGCLIDDYHASSVSPWKDVPHVKLISLLSICLHFLCINTSLIFSLMEHLLRNYFPEEFSHWFLLW